MWSHSVPQQREVSKRFILLTDHIEQCTGFQGIRNNALFLSTILVLNSTIMFTNSNNVRPSLEKYAEAIFFFFVFLTLKMDLFWEDTLQYPKRDLTSANLRKLHMFPWWLTRYSLPHSCLWIINATNA